MVRVRVDQRAAGLELLLRLLRQLADQRRRHWGFPFAFSHQYLLTSAGRALGVLPIIPSPCNFYIAKRAFPARHRQTSSCQQRVAAKAASASKSNRRRFVPRPRRHRLHQTQDHSEPKGTPARPAEPEQPADTAELIDATQSTVSSQGLNTLPAHEMASTLSTSIYAASSSPSLSKLEFEPATRVFAAIALKPFTKLPSFLDPLDQYIGFLHEIDKAPVVPELGFETQRRDPAEESDDTAPKKQIGHVLDDMDDLASDVEDIAQDMKDKCDWLVAGTEVATENLGDVHLNRAEEDAKFLEAVQRCLTRATKTVWETPSLWQTRDLLEEYMRLEESYGRS
ncbi:hypothetical protein JX265_008325 [Neoarthrinium moseri]|uniref:Uncharacterized protein n=1 Tax=Neoarthrinium moseri TaxID=1658444 RepID=A0A9P9WIR8_9PEZI|nr:hypothetical protein JX265_008325 [Neoarthrinium moseri]